MKDVPRSMRITGMFLFRSAFMEALYGQTPMCIVHAAHAAEILLKARIAQEHPLLIFSKLPKPSQNCHNPSLMDFLEKGRTLSYEELPDQLWNVTGIKIESIDQYRKFGKLRNQIIHFSMASEDKLDRLTLEYSLQFLDPLIENFWGKSMIEFIKRDPDPTIPCQELFQTGILEEMIRSKGFPIDYRLRRILGEESRKAWEEINKLQRILDHAPPALTDDEIEAFVAEVKENPYEEERQKYREKIQNDWDTFLLSF
ncbi:MAG: hypothetical protein AAFQ80_11460 [Cyanobacteria bacterium J06621_8]